MLKHHQFTVCAAVCASFAFPVLLTGCSDAGTISSNAAQPAFAVGNWQFSSASPQATRLPGLSGTLRGQADAITGILHSQSLSACVAPTAGVQVSGATDKDGNVKLGGALAGGSLIITGKLASDGKSLADASYNVEGGTCAFIKPADGTAQAYMPISGTYNGSFVDGDGQIAQITAVLNQSANADNDGNYTLTGSATLPNNPCFPATVPVSATQVTGGTFTFTYAANGNSVTANGTFSSDASTLAVTSWVSSGNCGADSGTGNMAVQTVP